MAKGFKTGGRKRGTPNRRTLQIAELLRAESDAPDGPALTPLEIIERCANRLYNAALHARSQGDFASERKLLQAAAAIAERAAPYRHPKMPATIITPSSLPPLRLMSLKQLEQLALELRSDEYEDVTEQESVTTPGQRANVRGPGISEYVASKGQRANVRGPDISEYDDLGISSQRVSEWREVRDRRTR